MPLQLDLVELKLARYRQHAAGGIQLQLDLVELK